jgi:hypothetical protein
VELTWTTDSACRSRDAVVREVERLVRGAPPKEVVVAHVDVLYEGSWRARLSTRSGDGVGTREIEADSCAQLTDAIALILALMIDPSAALADRPARDAPPVPQPGFSTAHAPEPTPRPSSILPVRRVVSVSTAGDVGSLPAAAPGFAGSVGLQPGAWRVMGSFAYFPPQRRLIAAGSPAGGDFTLLSAALVGCRFLLTVSSLRGALCAGPELNVVLAKGFGVISPRDGSGKWGALVAEALLGAQILDPLVVELRVGGVVPFARPSFFFDDLGTVYRPSVVGLRFSLGLTANF